MCKITTHIEGIVEYAKHVANVCKAQIEDGADFQTFATVKQIASKISENYNNQVNGAAAYGAFCRQHYKTSRTSAFPEFN